jgi:hypothetical protein
MYSTPITIIAIITVNFINFLLSLALLIVVSRNLKPRRWISEGSDLKLRYTMIAPRDAMMKPTAKIVDE